MLLLIPSIGRVYKKVLRIRHRSITRRKKGNVLSYLTYSRNNQNNNQNIDIHLKVKAFSVIICLQY